MLETNYKDIFKIDKKKLDQIDEEIFSLLEFWKSNKKEIKVREVDQIIIVEATSTIFL